MSSSEQQHIETVVAFIENASNQLALEQSDQFFARHIAEAFAERHFIIYEMVAQGDKVVARLLMTAVHTGPFAGHMPTGKTVTWTQFREFLVADGRIVEHRGWFDTATLLPQIQAANP